MTDFASQVRHQGTDYIVRSLLDVDFYKLTMAYFIFNNYRGKQVTFKLINRDVNIPLGKLISEEDIREQFDYVRELRLRRTDIYYLRGMDIYGKHMFSEEYMRFLSNLSLGDYELKRVDDQFELTFTGQWEVVTFWETIALAIISELYYRKLMSTMTQNDVNIMYARATDKLYRKLINIKKNAPNAMIADFGQRRRHSFLWQKQAVEVAHDILGNQFLGTSNTWLAFNQDLVPMGTNAHELPMVVTALAKTDEQKFNAQYNILKDWEKLFVNGLKIALPDTYGSEQFFSNLPEDLTYNLANIWRGIRQDSGNPEVEADHFIAWLKQNGVKNLQEKLIIFSDGLDDDKIIDLQKKYENQIKVSFGWGTKLTNDFEDCLPNENQKVPGIERTYKELFRPFSLVCKVVEVEGKPVVKLSNNINKATGPQEEIIRYKKLFGIQGMSEQKVEV
ncbi:nicotinate phosphoribosyltransferase [Zhouia sp. PK063]|uniref:nicotinate phosphoribosyltransferase n=1 Tax=Zhouia sp. PK063 TaxID=3373602 RepID=UPI003797A112